MHKLIIWFFDNLKNLGELLSIICAFFILAIVLCWMEAIMGISWSWLDFIKPTIDTILNFSYSLLPIKIHPLLESNNAKYIASLALFIAFIVIQRYLINVLGDLRGTYCNLHSKYTKNVIEKSFNKNLQQKVIKQEVKVSKYMVLINTQLKKKFSHREINIDVDEQNKLMNQFIKEQTDVEYVAFNGGFLYYFDDFNKIDNVLNVLFKVVKSSAPLDYAICIQSGDDIKQIKKLSELQLFGNIILCADTLLRYKYNKSHRYGTQSMGIYQKEGGTLEVHEFYEIS